MRPLLVFLACLVAGLAAGGFWTWAQPDRFRADARLLVRPASSTAVSAVAALAESSTVETNVEQTLRLSSRPHVHARRGDGGVLTVSVQAGERERARQIDAETVTILLQKVEQRFAQRFGAEVLDPAHAEEQTSPTPLRNLLICGLAGLAVGAVAAAALRARHRTPLSAADRGAEKRLQARIAEVTRRELAMARKAGELAAREQALAEHDGRAQEPEPLPQPEPEPAPVADTRPSRWNLNEVERLVASRRDVSPAVLEEWRTYLPLLRSHADLDGTLPAGFDSLLNDVFAELAPGRESS